MKVRELIEKLQKLVQDRDIITLNEGSGNKIVKITRATDVENGEHFYVIE